MFNIPIHSFYAMAAVLALLVIASIASLIIAAKNRDKDYTELRQRIQSWWWIVGQHCRHCVKGMYRNVNTHHHWLSGHNLAARKGRLCLPGGQG